MNRYRAARVNPVIVQAEGIMLVYENDMDYAAFSGSREQTFDQTSSGRIKI